MVILGPIDQVGWANASAILTASSWRRGEAAGTVRPEAVATGAATDVGSPPPSQALVDGAVLRIDRDDLGSGSAPGLLHHRCPGDQRLLVGQGQPLARLERGHGDGQTGEAHHRVEDDVGHGGCFGEPRDAGQHLGAGRDAGPDGPRRPATSSPMTTSGGPELVGLRDEEVDRALGGQGNQGEALRFGPQHVERLRADRACGSQQADRAHEA